MSDASSAVLGLAPEDDPDNIAIPDPNVQPGTPSPANQSGSNNSPSIPAAIAAPAPDGTPAKDETWLEKTVGDYQKSLDTVTGVAKLVSGSIASAAGQVAGAAGMASSATSQSQAGVAQSAAGQTAQANLEGAARDKLANDNLTVATAEGTTPQQMVDRANRLTGIAQQVTADDTELQKRAAVSIFDDPLTYIGNMFTTPFIQNKHDADLQAFKDESGILNQQQTETSDAAKVNVGLDAAHGADYTKSITTQIAGKAQIEAAQATMEAAKFQSSNATALASVSGEELNTAVKSAGVAGSAINEARNNLNYDATTGGKSGRSAFIQEKVSQLKQLDTNNQIVSSAVGRTQNPFTETEIRGMSTSQKAAFADAQNSILTGVNVGLAPMEAPLGSSPVDAAFNSKTLGILPSTPAEADTRNFIAQTAALAENMKPPPGQPGFHQLSVEGKKSTVNNLIDNQFKGLYNSIPASGSILSPGPMSSVLSIPAVASTDLGKALAPISINRLAPVNFDVIGAQAQKMIDDGVPIPNVAAQMKVMGQAMTAQVNSVRGLSKYALPTLGTDQNPSFNVNMTGADGIPKIVDLNSQAAIETYLTRVQVLKNRQEGEVQYGLIQ